MIDLAQLCVETAGRIAELNSKAIHESLDEQQAVALEASNECSPLGAWRLQTSFALAGTAKAAAYWRHLNEIALDAFTDAVGGAESRINSTFIALNRSLDEATDGVRASLLMEDVAPHAGRSCKRGTDHSPRFDTGLAGALAVGPTLSRGP
ncbi:TIGR01841 family phasin [Paraburkholderia sp. XV]|uniref:TIGR01841 family phasin n=1 Tax=Paraburkholderia sp. XV TaxID=2831520 RepID=UPI001CD3E7D4|nr:TIGR01841 family phasin [Paraburkholderia sp. XV]